MVSVVRRALRLKLFLVRVSILVLGGPCASASTNDCMVFSTSRQVSIVCTVNWIRNAKIVWRDGNMYKVVK
jgi:hypothetical protein